jgi:hypothetical protein
MQNIKSLLIVAAFGFAGTQVWGQAIPVPNLVDINYSNSGIGNWDISGGTVDVFGNGGFGFVSPFNNGELVDMDGSSPGQITTLIDVTYDGTVTVDFNLGTNFDGPPPIKALEVSLNGVDAPVLHQPIGDWSQISLVFTGVTAGEDDLVFTSLDGSLGQGGGLDYGPVIQDVTASESLPIQPGNGVPDGGSTLLLLGFATAGLLCLRRRTACLA